MRRIRDLYIWCPFSLSQSTRFIFRVQIRAAGPEPSSMNHLFRCKSSLGGKRTSLNNLISSAFPAQLDVGPIGQNRSRLRIDPSGARNHCSRTTMPEERSESPRFSHRHNADGSIDSICRSCFVTVATVMAEGALTAYERAHVCNPWILEHYKSSASSRQTD